MEEQVAQKSTELEQYLQRVRELEDMYGQLENALEDERRARQDEEVVRKLQARSVSKEWSGEKCFQFKNYFNFPEVSRLHNVIN